VNKKLLALTTVAAFSTSAVLANITVYGTAHIDAQVNTPDTHGTINSNNSTLGFKVSTELAGLQAYFKHEFIVGGLDGDEFLEKTDTSYISLAGDFGALRLGRQDTPATQARNSVGNNHLPDSIADFGRTEFTEYKQTKNLSYESNTYSGFKAVIGAIAVEDTTRDLLDSLSLGLIYDEGHGIKLGLGYETIDDRGVNDIAKYLREEQGLNVGEQKNDSSLLQFGGSYTFDNVMLGAQFEKTKNLLVSEADPTSKYGIIPQDGVDRTAFGISGKVTFGNNAFSVNLGTEKIEKDGTEANNHFAGVALNHTINKQVNTYIAFRNKHGDRANLSKIIGDGIVSSTEIENFIRQRAVAVGMVYKF
jgi:predicted porin